VRAVRWRDVTIVQEINVSVFTPGKSTLNTITANKRNVICAGIHEVYNCLRSGLVMKPDTLPYTLYCPFRALLITISRH
jgi:hypothetical protein